MSNITFLTSFGDEVPASAVIRAGGTDLQARLRSTRATPHIADLTSIVGYAGITESESGTRIGAGTTIANVASMLADRYPALAITAGGLATPQIRATATIAGNLTQHTRCWYYRHPDTTCFKSGGDSCPARSGRHLYGVAFDISECVHPHPSSIAMALLTYDTAVSLSTGTAVTIDDVLGDGTDPTRDHQLPDGTIIAAINLPEPTQGEIAAYFRSISRFEAEWPLVEAVVRIKPNPDGTIAEASLGLGGVATVPRRAVEAAALLTDSTLDDATITAASVAAAEGANPLTETAYKVDLITATVRHILEQAREQLIAVKG